MENAVLLMAYGGPDKLEDVEPYLLDVRGGRPTPPELVEEVRKRYAAVGGRSPLLQRTIEQAEALERELAHLGRPRDVYVGMRHWHPYIAETVATMVKKGVREAVAVAMAPHYSRMSVGAYRHKVEEALAALGSTMRVTFVGSWHDHPLFLDAVAAKLRAALDGYPDDLRESVAVVFTAHSLPRRILEAGDPYHDEFLASARAVAERAELAQWEWAYQSAASTGDEWLGPDLGARLDELHDRGVHEVLVVPIGVVCDHVEVLWDVDVFYRDYAQAKGMRLARTPSLNASPEFIRALAAIVTEAE